MGLNERQKRFVDEYIKDPNATQAAIRAGYSEKTARSSGQRLLTHVDVQSQIMSRNKERSEASGVDAAWLLNRLATLADVRISDLFDDDGTLRPPSQLPDGAQYLIAGIDVEEIKERDSDGSSVVVGYTRKVKLESRGKILEMIGKHIEVDAWIHAHRVDANLDADTSVANRMREARKRLRSKSGGG